MTKAPERCRHCERTAANRPRGLCGPCYRQPRVRRLYAPASAAGAAGARSRQPPPAAPVWPAPFDPESLPEPDLPRREPARGGPPRRAALRGAEERNRIVLENLRLVPHYLKRLRLRDSSLMALPFDDAMQAGCLGLLRAAELWEESRGPFRNCAYVWIRQYVQRAAAQHRQAWTVSDLFALVGHDEGDLDFTPPEPGPGPPELCCAAEAPALAAALLATLDPRSAYVLRRRHCDGARYIDIARELGVSRCRTEQIADVAMAKVRRHLNRSEHVSHVD